MKRVVDVNGPGLLDYKIPLVVFPVTQTASVSFSPTSDNTSSEFPSTYNVTVQLTTSDSQLLITEVTVDVTDLLTGSGTPAVDYTFAEPATITFPVGSPNLSTDTVPLSVLGANQFDDVDLGLENAVGATIGNGSFTLTLNPGAGA